MPPLTWSRLPLGPCLPGAAAAMPPGLLYPPGGRVGLPGRSVATVCSGLVRARRVSAPAANAVYACSWWPGKATRRTKRRSSVVVLAAVLGCRSAPAPGRQIGAAHCGPGVGRVQDLIPGERPRACGRAEEGRVWASLIERLTGESGRRTVRPALPLRSKPGRTVSLTAESVNHVPGLKCQRCNRLHRIGAFQAPGFWDKSRSHTHKAGKSKPATGWWRESVPDDVPGRHAAGEPVRARAARCQEACGCAADRVVVLRRGRVVGVQAL